MVELYSEKFRRLYFSSSGSASSIICVVIYLIAILIPLMLTFSGELFWIQAELENLDCKIRFTGEYVVNIITKTGDNYFCSSVPNLMKYNSFALTKITAKERDDKEFLGIEISTVINLPAGKAAKSIDFLPVLEFQTLDYVDLTVTDFISMGIDSPNSIFSAEINGRISLRQLKPFPYISVRSDSSFFSNLSTFDTEKFDKFNIKEVALAKFSRDHSLSFSPVIEINRGESSQIRLNVKIRRPTKIEVLVQPGAWHSIKIVIVRFVTYLLPFLFLARTLLHQIYEEDIFSNTKIIDLPQAHLKKVLNLTKER